MVNLIVAALGGVTLFGISRKILAWRKNYKVALTSGFPVFYSPVHISDAWWLMMYPMVVPLIEKLPRTWTTPWLQMSQLWRIWAASYRPFKEVGSDTFMLATPNGNLVWTCDPRVFEEVYNKHGKFQTPTDMANFFDIYGPTLGSVEGEEWRAHRKVLATGFNPAINTTVWEETQFQADTLVSVWLRDGSVVKSVKEWTSRLALHVIASGFFHKRLTWEEYDDASKGIPPGHQLAFEEALFGVVTRLATIATTPRALLGKIPFKFFREPYVAFTEWTKYMEELRDNALTRLEETKTKTRRSILESIVLAGMSEMLEPGNAPISRDGVFGDMFFTLLAGHESTGNAIAFMVYLMAIYPEYQQELQKELDQQLGTRPRQEWTVMQDYNALQKGILGAIQKETLRLYHPAQWNFRRAVVATAVLDSQGRSHVIPENSIVMVNFGATYHDPTRWTQRNIPAAKKKELHDSPALYFDPHRWLRNEGPETQIPPFGIGPRSCIGKAFAQVEMVSFVATVFKDYSVELVIPDETLHACKGDLKLAWEKTRDDAIRQLYDDVQANIAIYLSKDLPLRVVKRLGKE